MKLIYRGKAKDVYELDEDRVLIEFRDDLTAGDGAKKATKEGKGQLNAEISAKFMELLSKNGIPTHFIKFEKPNRHVAKKVEIIRIEVICRNFATGSFIRRYPFKDGQELSPHVVEFGFKSDEYHDPMINEDIAMALKLVSSEEEMKEMKRITLKVNDILSEFLLKKGIILVDFKLEFGYTGDGKLILADEISPDTCRFWDAETREIMDKDRFRRDLGDVLHFYREVKRRIEK